MSKIAVAGNASGTGTLTIAAPSTNSNQTITLPDATGTFVTADGSGNITIASGTANGVTYLNGSKVLTSGSALTFDGTKLQVNSSVDATAGLVVKTFGTAGGIQPIANFQRSDAAINLQIGYDGNTGDSFFGTTTNHNLYFISNNTERVRIDSSGNLLVGTTADSGGKLNVNGNVVISFPGNVYTDTSSRKPILATSYDGGTNTDYLLIGGPAASGGVGSDIRFTTGSFASYAERARIDSSGNLMVGDTSVGGTDSMSMNFAKSNGTIYVNHATGTASTTNYAIFSYAGGLVGNIAQSGTTAVLYNTTSDYRLKANQQPLTDSGAFIDALQPKSWDWAQDGSRGVGFIAHEFQEVAPNSVTGVKDELNEDGTPKYQAMQASSAEVIANLVAEIQSLRQRLDAAGL